MSSPHLYYHTYTRPLRLYADENEKKEKEAPTPTRPTSHATSYPIQN